MEYFYVCDSHVKMTSTSGQRYTQAYLFLFKNDLKEHSIHPFFVLLILRSGCRGWWRLSQLFQGEVGLHPGNVNLSLWGQHGETSSHPDSHLYIGVASQPNMHAFREETRVPEIITQS